MGHGSTSDVLGIQSSHLWAKRELPSFHLSIFTGQQSNLIWPLHLRAVTHGCSTPLQGCYKALISTGTMFQKQPSFPDVQPNLTATVRAEGKAAGTLIQTMENRDSYGEQNCELRGGPMSTRNRLMSASKIKQTLSNPGAQ